VGGGGLEGLLGVLPGWGGRRRLRGGLEGVLEELLDCLLRVLAGGGRGARDARESWSWCLDFHVREPEMSLRLLYLCFRQNGIFVAHDNKMYQGLCSGGAAPGSTTVPCAAGIACAGVPVLPSIIVNVYSAHRTPDSRCLGHFYPRKRTVRCQQVGLDLAPRLPKLFAPAPPRPQFLY